MPGRPQRASDKVPNLARLTLLVVDDHADTLDVLATYLRACGATVLTARSVARALVHVDGARKLDAIVTDLAMPHLDGVRLLKHVRAHRHRSELPVIALTGHYHDYAENA